MSVFVLKQLLSMKNVPCKLKHRAIAVMWSSSRDTRHHVIYIPTMSVVQRERLQIGIILLTLTISNCCVNSHWFYISLFSSQLELYFVINYYPCFFFYYFEKNILTLSTLRYINVVLYPWHFRTFIIVIECFWLLFLT